jgi:hypothetical protein
MTCPRVDFGGCGPLQPPKPTPTSTVDKRRYGPCLVTARLTFGSLLQGSRGAIYFRKERWVMSASQRTRPVETGREGARMPGHCAAGREAGLRRLDRTRAQSVHGSA